MSESTHWPADFERWRVQVDHALSQVADPASATGHTQRLLKAMQHATLLGGKRVRPLLVYATAHMFAVDDVAITLPAAAVELIHAYSLVHDDLPAMDNDVLRRGQPTVHVAFDEATAILAGDALQTAAFQLLAHSRFSADIRIAMVNELALASGAYGMCGGQAIDIALTGQHDPIRVEDIETLHRLKTGALLRACVRLGALCGEASADETKQLDRFSEALGLAFQIRDDILDIESDSTTLGKTAGKDLEQDKMTFPALIGIQASYARLDALMQDMQEALSSINRDTSLLMTLARFVIERKH